MSVVRTARCTCGNVEIEARGTPIVSAVCHCDDCQAGSRQLEALPGAAKILDAAAGTPYVLYRNDRIACTKGEHLLEGHKLSEKSATSRLVAGCCNAAMLVRFDDIRHWTSVYRDRFASDAPPLEMRLNTRFRPQGVPLPDNLPSYTTISVGFALKLAGARIAMLFG
jgi:hypothetical protein